MQQAVLKSLGIKIMEIKDSLKVFQLLKEGFQYIETDFNLLDGMKYIRYLLNIDANSVFQESNTVIIPSSGEKIDGIWYEIQDKEKTQKVLDRLF